MYIFLSESSVALQQVPIDAHGRQHPPNPGKKLFVLHDM